MAAFKVQQRHLVHRGRAFHFVSYEGRPADAGKMILATPPTWFLIASGKRWEVMTYDPDATAEQCDRRFMGWLDENVFAGT
ncbi:MAG: hypothetical protein MUC69_06465 [Gemmatimonadales bacterium]|jgi:hypothetical protein|nr:hypothetical protein [Gemmatimonadales bacterium]